MEITFLILSICSKIVLNLFYEQTISLFCFEVAFNMYLESHKQGILQKNLQIDQTDRCLPKDASCQLIHVLENFYAPGTQDAGVTKSLLNNTHLQITCCVQQQIAGLQIPMKHISRVDVFQSSQDLVQEVTYVVITKLLRLQKLVKICLHQTLNNVPTPLVKEEHIFK